MGRKKVCLELVQFLNWMAIVNWYIDMLGADLRFSGEQGNNTRASGRLGWECEV